MDIGELVALAEAVEKYDVHSMKQLLRIYTSLRRSVNVEVPVELMLRTCADLLVIVQRWDCIASVPSLCACGHARVQAVGYRRCCLVHWAPEGVQVAGGCAIRSDLGPVGMYILRIESRGVLFAGTHTTLLGPDARGGLAYC